MEAIRRVSGVLAVEPPEVPGEVDSIAADEGEGGTAIEKAAREAARGLGFADLRDSAFAPETHAKLLAAVVAPGEISLSQARDYLVQFWAEVAHDANLELTKFEEAAALEHGAHSRPQKNDRGEFSALGLRLAVAEFKPHEPLAADPLSFDYALNDAQRRCVTQLADSIAADETTARALELYFLESQHDQREQFKMPVPPTEGGAWREGTAWAHQHGFQRLLKGAAKFGRRLRLVKQPEHYYDAEQFAKRTYYRPADFIVRVAGRYMTAPERVLAGGTHWGFGALKSQDYSDEMLTALATALTERADDSTSETGFALDLLCNFPPDRGAEIAVPLLATASAHPALRALAKIANRAQASGGLSPEHPLMSARTHKEVLRLFDAQTALADTGTDNHAMQAVINFMSACPDPVYHNAVTDYLRRHMESCHAYGGRYWQYAEVLRYLAAHATVEELDLIEGIASQMTGFACDALNSARQQAQRDSQSIYPLGDIPG